MPEILNNVPELECDSEAAYKIEKQENNLNFQEYSKLVQTLNAEQKDIFYIIFKWCRNLRKSLKTQDIPKPFHLFVIGGAGAGKSHLINVVVNMAKRELQMLCDKNPEGTTVLLLAPTGCVVQQKILKKTPYIALLVFLMPTEGTIHFYPCQQMNLLQCGFSYNI